jgi:anti-sigma regulatory factor (Ser/Thr protein kinase)
VMGQLRNALRAYAAEGHDAVTIMSRTNRLLTDLATGVFATCCLVIVDPMLERADVVRAGHPPPLRRPSDVGRVSTIDSPAGLPLGIDAEEAYEVVQVPLEVGDVVVLLTDGLVEDPHTPMDVGYARIAGILEEHAWTDLEVLADTLVAAAQVVEHRSDDIAVLVVRHDGIDAAARPLVASKSVDREDPRAARAARDFIAAQLAAWHMDQLEETAVLLVSEVVTNALRHTSGAVTMDLTRLTDRVRVEVADDVTRTPTIGSGDLLDEGGRGVPLLDVLSDRWGTAPRGTGKVVWFELSTSPDARN